MSESGVIAVFPDPPPPELARSLDMSSHRWTAVGADSFAQAEPAGGYVAAIIVVDSDPDGAWMFARSMRKRDTPVRILVLVGGGHLTDLGLRDELFDDFCLTPFHPVELDARLRHLLWHTSEESSRPAMIEYSELLLNVETYQASIGGKPLDLTYMEYELLRFLAQNPGKVFTREILLSRVWGYEYYGGARTVDVHVRRLRAKLGEEHQHLIETVRSVGYRFGQSRGWRQPPTGDGILAE